MLDSEPSTPAAPRLSLKRRAFAAGSWTLGGHALSQVFRLGGNLIMTRLLVPEAFGVMAVAMIVVSGLTLFSDIGLKQSIVQSKRGSDPVFLNTAWVTQIYRGLILFVLALGTSLLLAVIGAMGLISKTSVYADPILPYVLAAVSFNFVLNGLQSTKLFEASRNLALERVTKMEIVSQLAGLLCMLGWAAINRSIWALVAGGICWTVVRVLLTHMYLPGVSNQWGREPAASREIYHFGKWIFLSSILGFLGTNGDRLILGALLTTSVFSVYVIAFLIFGAIQDVLTRIITEVSFPAISEVVRERPDNLRSSYYRIHAVIGSFSYFCAGVLMISGHAVIDILYDDRYRQAGWMLQILAVALMTIPFRVAATSLLALGLSRIFSNIIGVKTISLYVFVPLGFYFFGLPGALWGFVASSFAFLPMTIAYAIKHSLMDFRIELLMLSAWVVGMLVASGFNHVFGY
jgi:O-antigen/teichoic acid export membrane protein